jgi:hypothetical protein
MSGLMADMSDRNQVCLARRQICPIRQDFAMQKRRWETKTFSLGPDKLTTCKQDIRAYIN